MINSSREWVFKNIKDKGRSWVEENYDLHCQEVKNPTSTESYSRYIRSASAFYNEKRIKEDHPKVDYEEDDNTMNIISKSHNIRTLEQLLDYTRTNLAIWKVKKHRVNSWGSPTNPNFQVRAELERRKEQSKDSILEDLEKNVSKYSFKYPKIKRKLKADNKLMLEISIPDLHLGQLSWAKETKDVHYNIKIAKSVFIETLDYFVKLAKGYNISKILFPIGNDYFNVNSALNTTFSGTPQDEDCRWQKSFTYGHEMAVQGIDMLSSIADVDVLIIKSNHDMEKTFYLGEVLKAWYRLNSNVTIDNEPSDRKYYLWGKNLIGFDHGHGPQRKINELPLVMADEAPEFWSESKYREIHTAHLHSKRLLEIRGVRILTLPSLVPLSAWGAENAYGNFKEATAMLWDAEEGKKFEMYYHPENYTEQGG